jgi:NAD(P)-dependent dehydrogenase (short-subunit alcohol dehydrogenase family)
VLVNNAAIGVEASLLGTPLADYNRLMDVNVRSYFLYAQAAYPYLARRRGCMIHIASDAGIWGEQSIALYSVSKAAVVMLGKMLALEGGPDGVRSNVLCPGDTWPGMRHMARPGKRTAPTAATGRSRRSAGSARPATLPPRRPSTQATRLPSSLGRRCWSTAA